MKDKVIINYLENASLNELFGCYRSVVCRLRQKLLTKISKLGYEIDQGLSSINEENADVWEAVFQYRDRLVSEFSKIENIFVEVKEKYSIDPPAFIFDEDKKEIPDKLKKIIEEK